MISVQRKLPKDKGISCSPWYIGSARRSSILLCSEKVGTHDPLFFQRSDLSGGEWEMDKTRSETDIDSRVSRTVL